MTSKTPYELRHELLMLAQSILSEQSINLRIQSENDWNMKCEYTRMQNEKGIIAQFPAFPSIPVYDEDQVIAMAKKLNEFVSKND